MLRASLCAPRHDPKCFINVNGLNLEPALIINPPGHIGKLRKRAMKRLLPIDRAWPPPQGQRGHGDTTMGLLAIYNPLPRLPKHPGGAGDEYFASDQT